MSGSRMLKVSYKKRTMPSSSESGDKVNNVDDIHGYADIDAWLIQ